MDQPFRLLFPSKGYPLITTTTNIISVTTTTPHSSSSLLFLLSSSSQAGAVGVLIIDHGDCDESFLSCGYRAGSSSHGGFAPHDGYSTWKDVIIPSILITQSSGNRLRALMGLKEITIRGLGRQLVGGLIV